MSERKFFWCFIKCYCEIKTYLKDKSGIALSHVALVGASEKLTEAKVRIFHVVKADTVTECPEYKSPEQNSGCILH